MQDFFTLTLYGCTVFHKSQCTHRRLYPVGGKDTKVVYRSTLDLYIAAYKKKTTGLKIAYRARTQQTKNIGKQLNPHAPHVNIVSDKSVNNFFLVK